MIFVKYYHQIYPQIKKFIRSKHFFYLTLALFVIQAVFFAMAIKPNIPPDEIHHMGAIRYYSSQPLLTGPFTTNQPIEYMVYGDLTRNISYLYHYSMSLPVRLLDSINVSSQIILLTVRLTNVIFGIISLSIFYKLLVELNFGRLVVGLATFSLAMTGMFTFIHASAGYDPLALLLFFGFLWMSTKFFKTWNLSYLIAILCIAFSITITKHVYMPIIGLSTIFAIFMYLRHHNYNLTKIISSIVGYWQARNYLTYILVSLLIFLGGLFVERIGVNLVQYHSITVGCSKVHTIEECAKFDLFNRGNNTAAQYKQQVADGNPNIYNILGYSGMWLDRMYTRLFFYFGHIQLKIGQTPQLLASIAILLVSVAALSNKNRLLTSSHQYYVFTIASIYFIQLYFFNLYKWIFAGHAFAWQGRYLLPIIGFLYVVVVLILTSTLRKLDKKVFLFMRPIMLVFALALIVTHLPIVSFWMYTDKDWYTESLQEKLPDWYYNRYFEYCEINPSKCR